MKEAYSIYEAKAHLSELLRRVKAGQEVVVSERGVPIAKVVPLSPKPTFEERIEQLRSQGVIVPGKQKSIPKGLRRPGGLKRFLKERE